MQYRLWALGAAADRAALRGSGTLLECELGSLVENKFCPVVNITVPSS